jgi:alpha-L-fucosidase 2
MLMALAEAARVSLNARGDDGTGWSLAWKISFWARLKDGDRAYNLLGNLLRPTGQEGTSYVGGGGTYSNLLCAHPPFQLDGNMGGAAGMAEMLLQSHTGIIEFLPALPGTWEKGSVEGLKARGDFEISLEWDQGKLIHAKIEGNPGSEGKYKYHDQTANFKIPDDGIFEIEF